MRDHLGDFFFLSFLFLKKKKKDYRIKFVYVIFFYPAPFSSCRLENKFLVSL